MFKAEALNCFLSDTRDELVLLKCTDQTVLQLSRVITELQNHMNKEKNTLVPVLNRP